MALGVGEGCYCLSFGTCFALMLDFFIALLMLKKAIRKFKLFRGVFAEFFWIYFIALLISKKNIHFVKLFMWILKGFLDTNLVD